MKYFKKITILTLGFILSFNLVACKSKDIKESDDSSSAASCDSIDFSNVVYNRYNFEVLSFNYPSFLGVSKEGDNYITLATQDNSVSLKVYKEKSGTNFKNLYNYDMSSLKNINYDSYKDIRFSISGTNNNFEYYKSSILLGSDIFSFMMIYPVEYLDEFDGIVTDVYKAFVANLDGNGEQKKDVAVNNHSSNSDSVLSNGNKLQVATIDESGLNEDLPEVPPFSKLILLGDYIEGKSYDTQYCTIEGRNIINNKTIDNTVEYNKVHHLCGSVNYPDFMKPGRVPLNGKNVEFKSLDGNLYLNLGYKHNLDEDNISSYFNKLKANGNVVYSDIKNDKICIVYKNDNKISIVRCKVRPGNIITCYMDCNLDYYSSYKEKIDDMFKEVYNSFNTVIEDNLP